MKSALTGLAMGCLVVVGMVGWTMSMWDGTAGVLPLVSITSAFAIMSAVFIPSNTVSAIIGIVIRKWYLNELYSLGEIPGIHPEMSACGGLRSLPGPSSWPVPHSWH